MSAKKNNETNRRLLDENLNGLEIPDVLDAAASDDLVDDGLSGIPIAWEEAAASKEATRDGSESFASLNIIDRFLSDNDDVGIPLDFESILNELFLTFGESYDENDEGVPITPEEGSISGNVLEDENDSESEKGSISGNVLEDENDGESEKGSFSGNVLEDENDSESEKGSISGNVLEDENDVDSEKGSFSGNVLGDENDVDDKEENDVDSNANVEETEIAPSHLNEDDLLKLKELADSGDPEAMFRYARICEEGALAPRDSQRAFLYYREAAIRRNASAQLAVGLHYQWGLGARVDKYKAFQWFKRSARNHNAEALYQLGLCFAAGNGCDVNLEYAARCFRRSARAGVVDAQIAYGVALLHGRGTTRDVAKGKRWLRHAARRGSVAAKRTLRAFLDELEHAPKKDLSEQNPANKYFDFALDDLKLVRGDRRRT